MQMHIVWHKILMNGHLENFDKKFDEFHNVNTHIYQRIFIVLLKILTGKNSVGTYNNNALY